MRAEIHIKIENGQITHVKKALMAPFIRNHILPEVIKSHHQAILIQLNVMPKDDIQGVVNVVAELVNIPGVKKVELILQADNT